MANTLAEHLRKMADGDRLVSGDILDAAADALDRLTFERDTAGLALLMIKNGADDPQDVAVAALTKVKK